MNTPCHQTILPSYICSSRTVKFFILGTAAFLVVLLLKTTTQHQYELPEMVFIDQNTVLSVREYFSQNTTFSLRSLSPSP